MCTELNNALAWAQQATTNKKFPVRVYFTKHFGFGPTANSFGGKDAVHYAHGYVGYFDDGTPGLKGTLKAARNTDSSEMMVLSDFTYDVEILSDGTIKYTMKNKGNFGVPMSVQGTCVNGVLLTGASGSEVVTVGFAQLPSYVDDFPK